MQTTKTGYGTELQIWEKVRIVVGEGREAGTYEARVEDILNGGIIITEPVFVSGGTLLRNGLAVEVQVTRHDAAYQFHSRIRLTGRGTARRATLSPPRELRRIQRRQFARVEISARLTYHRVGPDLNWADWPAKPERLTSNVINISGGGILMTVDETVTRGDVLVLNLPLMDEAEVPSILPAVCRRTFVKNNRRYAGVEFIMGDELDKFVGTAEVKDVPDQIRKFDRRLQDRLVTFLFHKQIELRQKGLI